jgi:hypothetical protein
MANNRIFYAVQAVKVKPSKTTDGTTTYGSERVLRGIQSVGLTTNFQLQQIYQLGQLELYDNVEEVPNVEVTLSKALDGTRCIYNAVNDGSAADGNNLSLTNIADRRCDLALGIWDDTKSFASGAASYYVVCTGMYVSSVSYKLTSDGNFSEDVTLVGNHKKWGMTTGSGITSFNSGILGAGQASVAESKRITKRWALSDLTTIPKQAAGVASSGGVAMSTLTAASGIHLNSINITCNLGRESISELGRRSPYYRYINFPVEVTSEIQLTATQGDNVDADDFATATGCSAAASGNLYDGTLKAYICDTNKADGSVAYMIDVGPKNKLTSVNYAGGDTGGGNATVTYNFQTFNYLVVSGV